jgi:hypothetical protein
LLTHANRTALARHRTLEATVDWSYQLLTDAERMLFRRLAVFSGGWSLESAESIGADAAVAEDHVVEVLGRLVPGRWWLSIIQPRPSATLRAIDSSRPSASTQSTAHGCGHTHRPSRLVLAPGGTGAGGHGGTGPEALVDHARD